MLPDNRSQNAVPVKCWSLEELPPWIHKTYERIALISHPRHLAEFDPEDKSILLISCEWLTWQIALSDRRHCLHFQSLKSIPEDHYNIQDHYFFVNDWHYINGEDATMYRGVSLGNCFIRQAAMVTIEAIKLQYSLSNFIGRFKPKEVLFIDFHSDLSVLSADEQADLVKKIVGEHNIHFISRMDAIDPSDPFISCNQTYQLKPRHRAQETISIRERALRLYEFVAAFIGLLRQCVSRRPPKILLFLTQLNSIPLIDAFRGRSFHPLFLASNIPNKINVFSFVKGIVRGIIPVKTPRPSLSGHDEKALDEIRNQLSSAFQGEYGLIQHQIRSYIKKYILDTHLFYDMAKKVNSAENLLDKAKPDAFFTDGLQNSQIFILISLAKQRKIKTFVTLHAPYIYDVKVPIFWSDKKRPVLTDYSLTWGRIHDQWQHANSKEITCIRTGSPISQYARDISTERKPSVPKESQHVLLLHYSVPDYDLQWPQAGQYSVFVETIRMLKDIGYNNIRMRLHPGYDTAGHYGRVVEYFGLQCDFDGSETYIESLSWADLVIGPAYSGALPECIAAGKPYYPILMKPSFANSSYLEGHQVFDSTESLRDALVSGIPLDQDALLNDFSSLVDIPDPASRTWDVIEEILHQTD